MPLSLTRRPGESVKGGETVVKVVSVVGNKVRLAFEAPKAIRIVRTELLDRQRPKQAA